MKAAVVHTHGQAPVYGEFPDPLPPNGYEEVTMVAAGLHQLVRAMAAGTHYGSHGELPAVPGIDGVGIGADGIARYVGWAPAPYGTFSERTLVPVGAGVPVPEGVDPVLVAGFVNPAMGAWLPLAVRADQQAGESVLVVGATGTTGRLACAFAKARGASRVIAVGRDAAALEELAAQGFETVRLEGDLSAVAEAAVGDGVDVVVDLLWGPPAQALLPVLARRGGRRVRYVEVGSLAGASIALDSTTLRSAGIELLGSGLGSVAPRRLAAEAANVVGLLGDGSVSVDVEAVPLSDVETAWDRPTSKRRLVFVP